MSTTSVAADLILLKWKRAHHRPIPLASPGGRDRRRRVLAVDSNEDVRSWASRDVAGQTLLPGLYDSHNHTLLTGLNLAAVDLSGAKSVADLVRVMGKCAASASPGQLVLSSAWWHESQLAEAEFSLREELDDAASVRKRESP